MPIFARSVLESGLGSSLELFGFNPDSAYTSTYFIKISQQPVLNMFNTCCQWLISIICKFLSAMANGRLFRSAVSKSAKCVWGFKAHTHTPIVEESNADTPVGM